MPHPVCRGPVDDVGKKFMTMGAHCHQVAPLFLNPFDDLIGGFSAGQFGYRGDPFGFKFRREGIEVSLILLDFRTHRILTERPCRSSVGHMQEDDPAIHFTRERLHMVNDDPVGRPLTRTAGNMASARVITRLSHGLIRHRMKPSITTCPARVPVMVLLCPLARSATAKSVLATAVPTSGARVRKATRIQSLSGEKCTTSPPATVMLSLPRTLWRQGQE